MTNTLYQPHNLSYLQLAEEHDLTPEEVERTAQFFGNDFESLDSALTGIEYDSLEDFPC